MISAEALVSGTDQAALAYVLRSLGNPVRLQVLQWLLLRGPLTARELREFVPRGSLTTALQAFVSVGVVEVTGRERGVGSPLVYPAVPGVLRRVQTPLDVPAGRNLAQRDRT